MKKRQRFLSVLLALCMVVPMLSGLGSTVYAAGLPNPTNLKWEGNIAKWDAVDGAVKYRVLLLSEESGYSQSSHIVNEETTATEKDFSAYLLPGNTYRFDVIALASDGSYSSFVSSELKTIAGSIGTITGFAWGAGSEAYKLSWNAVADAGSYYAVVYKDEIYVAQKDCGATTSVDIANTVAEKGAGSYTVKVKAYKTENNVLAKGEAAYTGSTTTYAVTYAANGGTGSMEAGTANAGMAFTLPANGFTPPSGQQFKEWAIGSTSGTKVAAGGTHTFTAATTVYAIWENVPVTTYAVTYDANGGTGSMEAGTANAGMAFTLPANGFTPPSGQQFKEWAIGSTSGTKVAAGGTHTFTAATTVYAIWENIPVTTYAVTYDANGGTDTMEAGTANAGMAFTLPANGFTPPSGQQFKEWAIGSTSGTKVAAGGTHTFTAATTVYAIWENIPVTTYAVTVTGGTGGGNYAAGAAVTITAGAAPAGQQFKEWTGADSLPFTDGTGKTSATAKFTMPANAVSVTATYEAQATVISAVKLTGVTAPTVGGSATVAGIGVPAGANYILTGALQWYNYTDSKWLESGDTFAAGKGYYLSATFAPKSGYSFAAHTAMTAGLDGIDSGFTTAISASGDPVSGVQPNRTVVYQFQMLPAGAATITSVAVAPATASVQKGTTKQFTATVSGTGAYDNTVAWSIVETVSAGTSINASGLLTVAAGETASTLTVKATANGDGAKAGTATVTVTSAPVTTYLLTVTGGTGGGYYEAGTVVNISADAPIEGKQFKNWTTSDGGNFGNANNATTTYTMPAGAATVSANYENIPVTVSSIAVNSTTHKTAYTVGDSLDVTNLTIKVTKSNGTSETVNVTSGMVTGFNSAAAAAGQTLTIAYEGKTTTFNISITAAPPATTYAVTVNDSYAAATGAGSYAKDATVKIYAGSRSNYTFAGWTVVSGGVTITNPASKNATFTMPNNAVTVKANWNYNGGGSSGGSGSSGTSYNYYTITATAGKGGGISPSGSASVREYLDKTYTITPDTGYVISDVLVDGKSVGAVKTYTFKNVNSRHTISATFKADTHANPQTGVELDFDDVRETGWFCEDAVYVFVNSLMTCAGAKAFRLDANTARGMIVQFLIASARIL